MNEFVRFYGWGLSMKFHMAIYTLALVFFKALTNLLAGIYTVDSLTMLQMMLVSMAVAIAETLLFPEHRELSAQAMRQRTIWWVLLCNAGFLGGALALGWFAGIPAWAGAGLVVFLQGGIAAMWFGIHVVLSKDTKSLNDKLHQFQHKG